MYVTALEKENHFDKLGQNVLYLSLVISLFSIVRFANSGCTTSTGLNGTCFTSAECSSNGGVATGTCASGFGVCCVGIGKV